MLKNKIKLPNRDNYKVYLEKLEDKKYRLYFKTPFVRLGIEDKNPNEYTYIDPCGGPWISVGNKLDIGTVKSIYRENNDYIIEVK